MRTAEPQQSRIARISALMAVTLVAGLVVWIISGIGTEGTEKVVWGNSMRRYRTIWYLAWAMVLGIFGLRFARQSESTIQVRELLERLGVGFPLLVWAVLATFLTGARFGVIAEYGAEVYSMAPKYAFLALPTFGLFGLLVPLFLLDVLSSPANKSRGVGLGVAIAIATVALDGLLLVFLAG